MSEILIENSPVLSDLLVDHRLPRGRNSGFAFRLTVAVPHIQGFKTSGLGLHGAPEPKFPFWRIAVGMQAPRAQPVAELPSFTPRLTFCSM